MEIVLCKHRRLHFLKYPNLITLTYSRRQKENFYIFAPFDISLYLNGLLFNEVLAQVRDNKSGEKLLNYNRQLGITIAEECQL